MASPARATRARTGARQRRRRMRLPYQKRRAFPNPACAGRYTACRATALRVRSGSHARPLPARSGPPQGRDPRPGRVRGRPASRADPRVDDRPDHRGGRGTPSDARRGVLGPLHDPRGEGGPRRPARAGRVRGAHRAPGGRLPPRGVDQQHRARRAAGPRELRPRRLLHRPRHAGRGRCSSPTPRGSVSWRPPFPSGASGWSATPGWTGPRRTPAARPSSPTAPIPSSWPGAGWRRARCSTTCATCRSGSARRPGSEPGATAPRRSLCRPRPLWHPDLSETGARRARRSTGGRAGSAPADDGPGGQGAGGVELFEQAARESRREAAPLAERMRPQSLDEYVGQAHLLGPGRLLRAAIESGDLHSMILWGPPGTGKTTLASLMAAHAKAHFSPFSAVLIGIKEVRGLVSEAAERLALRGQRTILFVDEIHRFNKAQQDAFLPHVERGTVTLIGATTENPSFEVIAALLSRCRVYVLERLTEPELETIVRRAVGGSRARPGPPRARGRPGGRGRDRGALGGRCPHRAEHPRDRGAAPDRGRARARGGASPHGRVDPRGRAAEGASSTTRTASSTTTSSARSTSRSATPIPTRRSTGWPGCSRPARTALFLARRLVRMASEDIGLADPQALQIALAAKVGVRLPRDAGG